MANGNTGFDFNALFSNPLFGFGTGLLAAGLGRPTSVGEGLAQGLTIGRAQTAMGLQNQLQRERIQAATAQRAQDERQRAALERLQALMAPPAQPSPAAGAAAAAGREVTPVSTAPAAGATQNQEILGLLATLAPEQFAQSVFASAFPKPVRPTSFQRDFAFLTAPKAAGGQGLSVTDALDRLNKGVTVNVGDKTLDKPLSPGDLNKLQRPDGQSFPIGTTMRQAQAAGAVPITAERQKALDATEGFTEIFNEIEDLALGPVNPDTGKREGGIFSGIKPGFGSRAGAGLRMAIDKLTGEDPQVEQFEALTGGTLSNLAKLLGERGALAEGDVARVAQLLPQIRDEFLLPDTQESARRKLAQLRGILQRGVTRLRGNLQSGPRRRLLPGRRPRRTPPASETPRIIDFKDLPA